MNQRNVIVVCAAVGLSTALLAGHAISQQKSLKEQLIGTWTLVSAETTAQDGTKTALFGAIPKGIVMFDAGGRFAQIQVRADRPKFKANNRLQGTPEENKAALAGGVGQFGTWTINEAEKNLNVHMDAVVHYPNEEGTDQKRLISLTADELKLINPLTGDGGRAEPVYKRAK
jgi:Lipocalin-like domain